MPLILLRVAPVLSLILIGSLLWPRSVPAAPLAVSTGGGISLSQTRVIFLAADKAQTLAVKNNDQRAYLIQSRVQMAPDDTKGVPFVVTPPLFTLQPDNRQLLRIVAQREGLSEDRESVFYLSVLAIPAQEGKEVAPVQVSMGMRFVIKLFYRPAWLKEHAEAMACHLRFTRMPEGVRVENPTPYFQTLGLLMFDGSPIGLDSQPSMLAPLSVQTYPAPSGVVEAQWKTITDYGGLSTPCRQTITTKQE